MLAKIIGAVALVTALVFAGFKFHDIQTRKHLDALDSQLRTSTQEIQATMQKVSEAERRASDSDVRRLNAESRYADALVQLRAFTSKPTTTTAPPVPPPGCEEFAQLAQLERNARIACGEALTESATQITALKEANALLHEAVAQRDERVDLLDKKLTVVTQQRDEQERRKRWYRLGTAAGAIATLSLLLL